MTLSYRDWSYVGSKANKRWTWYIVERQSGVIVAWQNGDRSAATLQQLLDRICHLPLRVCHTDNWAVYSKLLPEKYFHIIGKDSTWKIERKNLLLLGADVCLEGLLGTIYKIDKPCCKRDERISIFFRGIEMDFR